MWCSGQRCISWAVAKHESRQNGGPMVDKWLVSFAGLSSTCDWPTALNFSPHFVQQILEVNDLKDWITFLQFPRQAHVKLSKRVYLVFVQQVISWSRDHDQYADLPTLTVWPWDWRFGMPSQGLTVLPPNLMVNQKTLKLPKNPAEYEGISNNLCW